MNTVKSEELIKEFCQELTAAGYSPQIAGRHRDKLRFFLHAYVAEEWPRDLDRIDGEIIRDFLGSWFLRHVGGAKSDLISYLGVFRRFYEFLYQTGRLSESEFDELEMVLASQDFFTQRYDEYFDPLPEPADGPSPPDNSSPATFIAGNYPSPLDPQLWLLVHNLEKPPAPALLDFHLFLDYIINLPVKLDPVQQQLPRRHVRRINQRFSLPEELPSHADMETSRRLTWFFHTALSLELLAVNSKGELCARPRAEAFLELDPEAQLTILIDATWNRVDWSDLGPPDLRQVSEWAQKHKDGFAALLGDLSPQHQHRLDLAPTIDRHDSLLARYIYFHDVVENSILFALRETGLLSYTRGNGPGAKTFSIKTITVSRFGRSVMRLFLKRASGASRTQASPLERLQQSLLSF